MSNEATGAAQAASSLDIEAQTLENATLAQADQWEADALVAIKQIKTPKEALDLLDRITVVDHAVRIQKLGAERVRRWSRVRLKAERKYGELLPEKTKGGRPPKETLSVGKSNSEHITDHKARAVAAVPPEVFDEYVDKEPKPTRTGLLKKAPKRTHLSADRTVINWVKGKRKKGWDRDKIVQASKANTDGWPIPGSSLSNGAMTTILARLSSGNDVKENARSIQARLKDARAAEKRKPMGEGYGALMKARRMILQLSFELQMLDVRQFGDDYIASLDIDTIYEELVDLMLWIDKHIGWFQARTDEMVVRRKIKALRNTTGRTDEEADTALKLADKIERKLKNRLSA